MRSLALLALLSIPAHLGYLAVGGFIALESMGIPSPGETAVVAGAVAAAQGDLAIEWVIVCAAVGAIIGDNIGFLIGRRGGRKLLETERGPFPKHRRRLLVAGDRFFTRHGAKAVFFGRWIALVRVTAAWMAGSSGMPFRRFFVYNAAGGITWAITIGLVGYALGTAGAHVLTKVGTAGAVVGALVLVGAWIWLRRRHRPPEEDEVEAEAEVSPRP